MLPLLLRRRQAAAKVALSRCCHRRSLHAAATPLSPPRFAQPPPPLTLLPPPHRCHAAADVTLAFVDCYLLVSDGCTLKVSPPSGYPRKAPHRKNKMTSTIMAARLLREKEKKEKEKEKD